MDMVERVAEAIAGQLGLVWRLLPEVADSDMTPSKVYFRFQARAAIEAMREPTKEMEQEAIAELMAHDAKSGCAAYCVYVRAIDAALGE